MRENPSITMTMR